MSIISANPRAVLDVFVFADPIAEIAVLTSLDNQQFFEQANAYDALTTSTPPLSISEASADGPAFLLSLTNKLIPCVAQHFGGPLCLFGAEGEGGMSNSPPTPLPGDIGNICFGWRSLELTSVNEFLARRTSLRNIVEGGAYATRPEKVCTQTAARRNQL